MDSRSKQILSGVIVAVLAAFGALGCGSGSGTDSFRAGTSGVSGPGPRAPGSGKPAVTIGTKNFTEELILGQLYAQALRAKGYSIKLKSNLGASELVDRKLVSGQIDGYPEYTGTILSVVAHDSRRPPNAVEAYKRAASFERRRGTVVLAMAPAEDTDVLVTKPVYAAQHRLSSISDLARLGSSVTVAAAPEFRTRLNGLVGLRRDYGLRTIRFIPVKIGTQYQALEAGRVQVAAVFTTDGNLSQGGFALLRDPRNIFGFQNVTFLVRRKVLDRAGPAFEQTINAVSAKLSTQALRVMNAAVDLDQQSPAIVARQFLRANGMA
jgi:osmoprotectant transport system substrate-binding protein